MVWLMFTLLFFFPLFCLLSDDPATWAGLMAACHTENTSCYLSGSAPCRQGLEQILMAVVSEKGVCFCSVCWLLLFECRTETFVCPVAVVQEIERPLAQALEGWILQQAVTGLILGGQLDQAEALCSQVGYKHTQDKKDSDINTKKVKECCININQSSFGRVP